MSTVGQGPFRVKMPFILRTTCIALVFVFSGCAANYGSFKVDAEVAQTIRSGERQEGYQYYYSGRETMPYAIIGVDRQYTVSSPYWTAFSPPAQQLKLMSRNIFGKNRSQPYGAQILAPDGQVVGVWYAILIDRTVRVDTENRTVDVFFKNPESRNQN